MPRSSPTHTRAKCQDGVERHVTFTGEANSAFTRPARVSALGKTISGYVTSIAGETRFVSQGKHAPLMHRAAGFLYAPNVDIIGFCKRHVEVGDLIVFLEGERRVYGRVVALPESLPNGLDPLHYVEVLALSDSGTHGFLRIVRDEEIVECQGREVTGRFLTFFAGELPEPEVLREMAHYGSLADDYIHDGAERARERLAARSAA